MKRWWLLGAAVGHVVDRLWGEPPVVVHPVALAGRGLASLEAVTYRPSRAAGVVHVAAAAVGAVAVGEGLRRLLGGGPATAAAVAVAGASRMLAAEALYIGELLEAGCLDAARERLPTLVGRSADDLDEAGVVRAVVESVAENTVDAVTATIVWAHVAGPVGVCLHRVVNTLDAMVGHRSSRYEHFGWASARLDDALGYVPARTTVLAVAIARPRRARVVLRTVRRDAGRHPSPNGGVVEAAFAGALGVTLGGVNRYGTLVEDRGRLGDGPPPDVGDIAAAVRLSRRASTIVAVGPPIAALLVRGLLARGSLVGGPRRFRRRGG